MYTQAIGKFLLFTGFEGPNPYIHLLPGVIPDVILLTRVYNLLPLTTACMGPIHSVAIDDGVYGSYIHVRRSVWLTLVVKGNGVYEAVVTRPKM